jgi:hypothetical protein
MSKFSSSHHDQPTSIHEVEKLSDRTFLPLESIYEFLNDVEIYNLDSTEGEH